MSVLRLPQEPGETAPIAAARAEAAQLADPLERRIPSVRLVFEPGQHPAEVRLDERQIPSAAMQLPNKADPGEHTLVVLWANGRSETHRISLLEGQRIELELLTPQQAAAPPEPAVAPLAPIPRRQAPPKAPTDTADAASSRSPTLAYVGFGTAAVAVAVGAVTGGLAMSRTSKLEKDCPDLRCVCADETCRASRQDEIDGISRLATITNGAAVVGLIGLGVGLYGIWSYGEGEESRGDSGSVDAYAGWGRLGVRGTF